MELQQGEDAMKVEIPRKVEEVWERSPHLPSPQRLNAAFSSISVTSFPRAGHGKVIEISSDASIAEAVQVLARNNILSAPVRDIEAPEDASWIDRYLGIVEFAGIILWLLQQSKGTRVEGDFFEALASSSFYRQSKVKDIVGSFRWAPFLPVEKSDSLLTVLLLLSKYHMKCLPVVEAGQAAIENFITQSAVLHVLSQCIGLPWFDTLGKLSLAEIGLPIRRGDKLFKIFENEPVLHAFELMKTHGVGGVPVVSDPDMKPIGNISVRDVKFLLTAPATYNLHRTITARDFIEATKSHLEKDQPSSPILKPLIVCSAEEKLQQVILKLDKVGVHRIYIVDEHGNLDGVVTLRDIISKFVDEPPGYFGDFFAGVVPGRRFS